MIYKLSMKFKEGTCDSELAVGLLEVLAASKALTIEVLIDLNAMKSTTKLP